MKCSFSFSLKFLLPALLASTTLFTSCDKDDDHNHNDQELITTVRLTFTEAGGGSTTFTVKDLDGDGGNPPVAEEIKLKSSTAYTLGVAFLDESKSDHTHDLTAEVKTEAEAHLVCFAVSGSMAIPTIGDQDKNGKPLGLESALTTGPAGTGTFRVVLKHEPDKTAADPCKTGETDVDVTFQVVIQ